MLHSLGTISPRPYQPPHRAISPKATRHGTNAAQMGITVAQMGYAISSGDLGQRAGKVIVIECGHGVGE